ncbi:hypothetical protein DdX_12071 [Ditylenchus destructor]|uniref:Uncharacterized protein n=1 Tax=Ditylenchus destructor TaxID=166010 RepID=A0AAD4N163_9BILA|nr:hypothetical protein DdX_12071 [Ditylenchus destructor]
MKKGEWKKEHLALLTESASRSTEGEDQAGRPKEPQELDCKISTHLSKNAAKPTRAAQSDYPAIQDDFVHKFWEKKKRKTCERRTAGTILLAGVDGHSFVVGQGPRVELAERAHKKLEGRPFKGSDIPRRPSIRDCAITYIKTHKEKGNGVWPTCAYKMVREIKKSIWQQALTPVPHISELCCVNMFLGLDWEVRQEGPRATQTPFLPERTSSLVLSALASYVFVVVG